MKQQRHIQKTGNYLENSMLHETQGTTKSTRMYFFTIFTVLNLLSGSPKVQLTEADFNFYQTEININL